MYARFTKTAICSSIIQNSKATCGVADDDARPVCAETCVSLLLNGSSLIRRLTVSQAEFAQSEALVSADTNLCPQPGDNLMDLIRADFTTCGLPDDALTPSRCIKGIDNEMSSCPPTFPP